MKAIEIFKKMSTKILIPLLKDEGFSNNGDI
jgi:hypothetical protein